MINLDLDKLKGFKEAYRVLNSGGKMLVSDIVLLGQFTDCQRYNEDLLTGCVSGALLKDDYIGKMKQAGFTVKIAGVDKEISQTQYNGLPIESLKNEVPK